MSNTTYEQKTAIVLLNVGTPDQPNVKSVRRFLSEFLNDPYVINIPWFFRKLLVNLIIVPFRAPKSTKLYQQLWTKSGSPLLIHAENLKAKLQDKLGNSFRVYAAMRYGNPSIKKALLEISKSDFKKIVLVPLFPQFAASTTETAVQKVLNEARSIVNLPKIEVIDQFYAQPEFIDAWVSRINEYQLGTYDHVLFSYHGLPLSHIAQVHPEQKVSECSCELEMPKHGHHCYKATIYETTRLLVKHLGIKKEDYSVGFQSRLTNKWLSPFTDEIIQQLAKEGHKRILILAPAFVADCLETKVELGIEYAEIFQNAGGEKLQLVESLNDSEAWVNALCTLVLKR